MQISIETFSTMFDEAIENKDGERTLLLVLELKELVRNDPLAIKWITEPTNINHIHEQLVEHLEVPQKAMRLRNPIPNRQRRAWLFVEALENGIRRVVK